MKAHLLRLSLCLLFAGGVAMCQWKEPPATGSPPNELRDRTPLAGQSGLAPLLDAKLLDRDSNARQGRAVIQVETDGVVIVPAAEANYQPKLDEAHIEYRLDQEPPRDTTSKRIVLEKLAPGEHVIHVSLVASDGRTMGVAKTLTLRVR